MDDYLHARELMDVKTLVTRVLEKRGVLARIRAELRANVFAAIEEEDRNLENEENPAFALLGTCNQRAKELHASPTGKLLTALICGYLEWCHLEHTLKVYLPECNLPKGFWKSEMKEKLGQEGSELCDDEVRLPYLAQILESYLKREQQNAASNLSGSFARLVVRKMPQEITVASDDSQFDADRIDSYRRSSSSLTTMGRKGSLMPFGQSRNATASARNYEMSTVNNQNTTEKAGKNQMHL